MSGPKGRIVGTRLIAVGLIALLLGVAGCAKPASEKPGTTTAPKPSPNGKITKDSLPSEPGYSWDTAQYQGADPLPVSMQVAGPWTLTVGSDWPVTTSTIVDPQTVPGIGQFADYTFVVGSQEFGEQVYYPRQMTDTWMQQLGKIAAATTPPTVDVYRNPLKLWPLNFAVGDKFTLAEGGSFGVNATVLAQNTVTVPAGTIEDAYLLRYDYTPLAEGAVSGSNYYILAPEVGVVAVFGVASGDEATGFTALDSANVLVRLPEKR